MDIDANFKKLFDFKARVERHLGGDDSPIDPLAERQAFMSPGESVVDDIKDLMAFKDEFEKAWPQIQQLIIDAKKTAADVAKVGTDMQEIQKKIA